MFLCEAIWTWLSGRIFYSWLGSFMICGSVASYLEALLLKFGWLSAGPGRWLTHISHHLARLTGLLCMEIGKDSNWEQAEGGKFLTGLITSSSKQVVRFTQIQGVGKQTVSFSGDLQLIAKSEFREWWSMRAIFLCKNQHIALTVWMWESIK